MSIPYWQLLAECARRLSAEGRVPFTRQDLIACVKQTYPGANLKSLHPMIQAITVNAPGGVRGGSDKRILWRVDYGLYELYQGQDGGNMEELQGVSRHLSATPEVPGNRLDTGQMSSSQEYSGDSSAQRRAEDWLVIAASEALHARLEKRRFPVADGVIIEVDGYCAEPPILCEVWAHIGPPKVAQKHKVMTDALKLAYARHRVAPGARCILVFGDTEATSFFQGSSWMAACLKDMGIEMLALEMPEVLRESVMGAQRRQYR